MAPDAKIVQSSQEALLQLEKGTAASPTLQLKEAAQIIGIDLTQHTSPLNISSDVPAWNPSTPKEEWVLRWLLKKLKTIRAYRVEPTSFILLQQLIHRILPQSLAVILADQKLLVVVSDVVTDLEAGISLTVDDASSLVCSGSESSGTIMELPHSYTQNDNRKCKKRKRTDYEEDRVSSDKKSCLGAYLSTFTLILDCLCSLVVLANKKDNALASSHLTQALKGELKLVAGILRCFFKVSALLVAHLAKERTNESRRLISALGPVFDLWEMRSSHHNDPHNNSSNVIFADNCFLEALRLQHIITTSEFNSGETAHILQRVERLIALHVVLPARGDFIARGGTGIDYSTNEPDWSSVKPVSDAFRSLLAERVSGKTQSLGTEPEKQKETIVIQRVEADHLSWKPAELLPTFLDIAIRSVPRDTFRRQTDEAPWLETFFVAIAELAFSAVKKDSFSKDITHFILILERMFRVVLRREVKLSLHTLLTHAAFTGLLRDGVEQVQWNLTALLVELGVDIFLPNSGLVDSGPLLNALLEKIRQYWCSNCADGDETYSIIKAGIVIPLLRGFTAARDLPTFIQLWREQLALVESARLEHPELTSLCVWEDDDIGKTYCDLMKLSLTKAQVFSLTQNTLSGLMAETGEILTSPRAYGQFVILEAGSRGLTSYGDSDRITRILKEVTEASATSLSSEQVTHWRWRLWRFAENVIECIENPIDDPFSSATNRLMDAAVNTVRSFHREPNKSPYGYAEVLQAYQFVLTGVERFVDGQWSENFAVLTEEIPPFLNAILHEGDDPLVTLWNGRVETLNSAVTLATGYLVTLLRTPEIWSSVKAETRQALFDQIFSLAASEKCLAVSSELTSSPQTVRFLRLWNCLVSHEYLLNVPHLGNDVLSILSNQLKTNLRNQELSIMSLQGFPSRLVSRHYRGIILDLLQDIILKGGGSPELSADMLSLMAKLANMPKSSAKVTSDWEVIWKIATNLSLQRLDVDLRVIKSFRSLAVAVTSRFLTLPEKERHMILRRIYRRITSTVSKEKSVKNTLKPLLNRICLSQLWNHRIGLSNVFDISNLELHRKQEFKALASDLQSIEAQLTQKVFDNATIMSLIITLDALDDFEDIVRDSEKVENCLLSIERTVLESPGELTLALRLTRRCLLARRKCDKGITTSLIEYAETFPLQRLHGEALQHFVRGMTELFRSMGADELIERIRDMREAGFSGENSTYQLLLSVLAAASLDPVEEKETSSSQEISALCTATSESLRTSSSTEHFFIATECLDILLRYHSRAITQWNVDNILATVSVVVSKLGPQVDPKFSGTIYVRLCLLLGLLFSLYRQKLGGRFHLILPAMQRLLACLFTPNKNWKLGAGMRSPWLAPLDASHAIHFTRLLTSLCDPTISAVSRPIQSGPGRESLTDQTKKAKRAAGQYLQYLIMEYTKSTLSGALDPEIKAALVPGLYAILDVMSRDTMKALNAALDASSRAVFKALYGDYVKFGKWNDG